MGERFSRVDLYELVWSEPIRSVAVRVGISNVALAKACRRANIPVPERGYWAKQKAGRPIAKVELPPRFPGASDEVVVGADRRWHSVAEIDPDWPSPPPPEWTEPLEAVRNRVGKIVGKVSLPRLDSPHKLIAALMSHEDEARRSAQQYGYSIRTVRFDQRQLRILNALFVAAERLGCRPSISTAKYPREDDHPSIHVGDTWVQFSLTAVRASRKSQPVQAGGMSAAPLSLTILASTEDGSFRASWEDQPGDRLEAHLTEILTEMVFAAEVIHRRDELRQFNWQVERRAQLIEERKRRQLEAERAAREARERAEKQRIDRLLAEADALRKATDIREYVRSVLAREQELSSVSGIELWTQWALAEADRIDPVINGTIRRAVETIAKLPSDEAIA